MAHWNLSYAHDSVAEHMEVDMVSVSVSNLFSLSHNLKKKLLLLHFIECQIESSMGENG